MASKIKVNTQGQSLVVTITTPAGTAPTVYTSSAISGTHTMPLTISSDTEFWLNYNWLPFDIQVAQRDGTVLYSARHTVSPDAPVLLSPEPSRSQLVSDVGLGLFGYLRSTTWYYANYPGLVGSSTAAQTVDELRLSPWAVPNAITIASVASSVSSAGGAGSVYRIGLYADTGQGYPGALVKDFGTIDGTSATVQTINNTDFDIAPGLYWIGGAAQVGTQPTMHVYNSYLPGFAGSLSRFSATGAGQGYVQTGVTGALPTTFTTTMASAVSIPRVQVLTG